MDSFGIADIYRAGRVPLSPELLKLRQEPFEALSGNLTLAHAVDLTRLYFGISRPSGNDWFYTAFHTADTTFSLHDNAQEIAVLAGALLAAAVLGNMATHGLAPLTANYASSRQPLLVPELLPLFEKRLAETAIRGRTATKINVATIKAPAVGKIAIDALALPQTSDWEQAGKLIKQAADEANVALGKVADASAAAIKALTLECDLLREETNMLWWHVGGVSRLTNIRFASASAGVAAILAGIDMSDLSMSLAGPYSAPALLQRTITAGRKGKPTPVSLQEAVDEVPVDQLGDMLSNPKLLDFPDVCPVLFALKKCQETGGNGAWVAAFEKVSGLSASKKIPPLDLAIQTYREHQLLDGLR